MPQVYGLMHLQLLSVHFQLTVEVPEDQLIIFFLRNQPERLVMFLLRVEQHRRYHGRNFLVLKDHKVLQALRALKVSLELKALKALSVHRVRLVHRERLAQQVLKVLLARLVLRAR
jgi:hypothetical protein